jgi:hypothetical protein
VTETPVEKSEFEALQVEGLPPERLSAEELDLVPELQGPNALVRQVRFPPIMDTSRLVPGAPDRTKQIQDAKDMYQIITRNAERTGSAPPPYKFLELIGKGAFGRVYKW